MDGVKIEQVLNNLITNAIEHSPENAVVEVLLSTEEADIVVSVRDAGPGIPAKERETLFTPFVRGGAVKSAGSKSTGLGLAISKKIVESHGGRIWIEENPGGGAAFVFCIPLKTEKNGETT